MMSHTSSESCLLIWCLINTSSESCLFIWCLIRLAPQQEMDKVCMLLATVNAVTYTVRMRTIAYNNITVHMLSRACCIQFIFLLHRSCSVNVMPCLLYTAFDWILKSDNQIELISMLGWPVIVRLNSERVNCYSCQLYAYIYYYYYHHCLLYAGYPYTYSRHKPCP